MPEYTYDPAAGEAVETTRGASGLSTPDTSPTIEEVESRQVNQFASGMGRRARLDQALAAPTDEDIDSGNYDPRQAEVETMLNEAIAMASKADNPSQRAMWEAKAEKYASALVGNQLKDNTLKVVKDWDKENLSARQELENSSIDVAAALAFAGDSDMSDESIEAWNTQLQSKNKTEAKNAAVVLDAYRKNPDFFTTEDFISIPESLEHEIVDQYGEHVAHVIATTSQALANGIAKPSDVIRMYSQDLAVQKAVMNLMKQGKIVLPI